MALVAYYWHKNYFYWSLETFLIFFIPTIIIQLFSMRWHIVDEAATFWHWISHICLSGLIHRCVSIYFIILCNPYILFIFRQTHQIYEDRIRTGKVQIATRLAQNNIATKRYLYASFVQIVFGSRTTIDLTTLHHHYSSRLESFHR